MASSRASNGQTMDKKKKKKKRNENKSITIFSSLQLLFHRQVKTRNVEIRYTPGRNQDGRLTLVFFVDKFYDSRNRRPPAHSMNDQSNTRTQTFRRDFLLRQARSRTLHDRFQTKNVDGRATSISIWVSFNNCHPRRERYYVSRVRHCQARMFERNAGVCFCQVLGFHTLNHRAQNAHQKVCWARGPLTDAD